MLIISGDQEITAKVNETHSLRSIVADESPGRHALVVSPSDNPKYSAPPATNTLRSVLHTLWQMVVYWPIWDVSFLAAQWFTWGSVVWCINAFFVWLPSVRPPETFKGESEYAGGITAFIGATIFEIGSVFLMIEAVNENRSDCFGWKIEEVLEEGETALQKIVPHHEGCTHHHSHRYNLVGNGRAPRHVYDSQIQKSEKLPRRPEGVRTWIWWPTYRELRTHYIYDIGFLACSAQMFGATVFWISGFTALPEIKRALSTPCLNGAYWFPQVLGGCGFIVSSLLFCLETQPRWRKPAPHLLGWWIGFWNLIGAVGFTMSGAFGYWVSSKGTYQAGLSTFWGSWAFLLGSLVQWYESLVKHPVEVEERDGKTPWNERLHAGKSTDNGGIPR